MVPVQEVQMVPVQEVQMVPVEQVEMVPVQQMATIPEVNAAPLQQVIPIGQAVEAIPQAAGVSSVPAVTKFIPQGQLGNKLISSSSSSQLIPQNNGVQVLPSQVLPTIDQGTQALPSQIIQQFGQGDLP